MTINFLIDLEYLFKTIYIFTLMTVKNCQLNTVIACFSFTLSVNNDF